MLELDHMNEITADTVKAMVDVGLKELENIDFTFTPVTPKAILYLHGIKYIYELYNITDFINFSLLIFFSFCYIYRKLSKIKEDKYTHRHI